MHIYTLQKWQHNHNYMENTKENERKTSLVVLITSGMMVLEILAGIFLGSMALLADGWHMATHAAALGISVIAYRLARRHAKNKAYAFGTGKVCDLGAFASGVVLAVIAIYMGIESVSRIFSPQTILFDKALLVALIGLLVNLISAYLLREEPHSSAHHHEHNHQDHNLQAAYLHVVADALTSVFAIVALLAGKLFGWVWMDPIMGVVGAIVIIRWSYGLLKSTGKILLDASGDENIQNITRQIIEADADNRVTDLHLWQVGPGSNAAIISLVTHHPKPPDYYKSLLEDQVTLQHVTVEVHPCPGESCISSGLSD